MLDAEGEIIRDELIANTRECLEAFSRRFPGAVIAMETGTHSPRISRLFEARGHRVIVANSRKVRAITTSNRQLRLRAADSGRFLNSIDPSEVPELHRSAKQSDHEANHFATFAFRSCRLR